METKQDIKCLICQQKSNFIYNKGEFNIYKCSSCALKFVWPTPQNLSNIYKEDYFNKKDTDKGFGYTNYNEDKVPMLDVFTNELINLERKTTDRKIFDIGAATGFFLDVAKKRGWDTNGCEISEYACEEARKRGHKIFRGAITDYKNESKYNVVTMWDVLEHVGDPGNQLKKVNNLLESGGFLLLNTIDADSSWAKIWGKNWNMIIPPEHLIFFSKKSLNILLTQNGFEIESTKKLAKNFSLSYIFKVLYEWQKVSLWLTLSKKFGRKFWRKFNIPINVRDNIFIVAKKIKDV